MTETPKVNLNFDQVLEPITQAFNRVQYFSGIAEEIAANELSLINWTIKSDPIAYNVKKPNKESLSNICQSFELWTNRNLVRDVLESLYVMLDHAHWACLILDHVVDGRIKSNAIIDGNSHKIFCNSTIESKLKKLKQYGIIIDRENKGDLFRGLKDIRNCISHAQGRVTEDTGYEVKKFKDKRKIYWKALRLHVQTESGKKQKLVIGKVYEEAGNICIQFKRHERVFTIGQQIYFNRVESYEIAWTIQMIAQDALKQLVELYEQKGVKRD